MDQFTDYLKTNPQYIGLIFLVFGIVILISAICDANWLFKDVSTNTYDLKKLDGIINRFGRKTGRYAAGAGAIFMILFGVAWFWYFKYHLPGL